MAAVDDGAVNLHPEPMLSRILSAACVAVLALSLPRGLAAQATPDEAVISAYQLTLPSMTRAATVNRALAEELRRDPRREDGAALSAVARASGKSLKEMEAAMLGYAPMAAALRTAGIEAREYAIISHAMMRAGMTAAMLESGSDFDRARFTPVQIANAKLVREHEGEMARFRRAGGR